MKLEYCCGIAACGCPRQSKYIRSILSQLRFQIDILLSQVPNRQHNHEILADRENSAMGAALSQTVHKLANRIRKSIALVCQRVLLWIGLQRTNGKDEAIAPTLRLKCRPVSGPPPRGRFEFLRCTRRYEDCIGHFRKGNPSLPRIFASTSLSGSMRPACMSSKPA